MSNAPDEGKCPPVADELVPETSAGTSHRFPERLDQDARRSGATEGFGKTAAAAADVDNSLSHDGGLLLDERHRVVTEQRVIPILVVELGPKPLEEPDRPPHAPQELGVSPAPVAGLMGQPLREPPANGRWCAPS